MILLIDNYDSFVYNLARYVGELGGTREVIRNDAISVEDIKALKPSHIIISPGPGGPHDAGISMDVVRELGPFVPILGVCLGHQVIGQVFGGTIEQAKYPKHGKASTIFHDEKELFQGLPNPLSAARYHSLIISEENFPDVLKATAYCEAGEIMAVRHQHLPIFGVQFHPESILTESGHHLLKNFLRLKVVE